MPLIFYTFAMLRFGGAPTTAPSSEYAGPFDVFRFHLRRVVAFLIAGYLAVLVPYWLLSADEKAEIIREMAGGKSLYSSRDPKVNGFSVLQISNVYFGLVGITAFSLACMQLLPHAFKGGALRRPVFFAAIFYLICLANAVLGTVGVVIDSFTALVVAGFIMGVPFGGLYFIGEFFPWAVYESKLDFDLPDTKDSEVVRRSYLKSVDITRVDAAVKVAMEEKRLFADPDLSLAALAAALGLSTHQLSEYLNRHAWNPDANNYVLSLALSGTILYAGGGFTSIGGASRNRLAAFDTAACTLRRLRASAE